MSNVLKHGYILPLSSTPPFFYAKNNQSSLRNQDFVEDAIENLSKGGLIKEVQERPHCVNPLTVAEKGN